MLADFNNDKAWRDCIRWLIDCGVLRNDHRLSSANATIVDFANILRDGVLLCNLLHHNDPKSIDYRVVNQRPQMAQFLCSRNIQAFVTGCRNHYKMREDDIFEPSMLFDLSDFHSVLYTLSKLSNNVVFGRQNIPGFSISRYVSNSQEDIYRDLQLVNLQNRTKSHQKINEEENEFGTYYSHIISEKVYQDLCSIKPSNRSNLNQINSSSTSDFGLEKRDHVIKELIDTETNYVHVLAKLQKYFMKPLTDFLSKEDFNIIFFSIKDLLEIHIEFLNAIRKACSLEYNDKLGNVFLNWKERFLIYGAYCVNLPVSQNLLQDLCNNNEKLAEELVKCQNEANNGKFKLRDILSVPMQRILKYHLLLDKLVQETEMDHYEYKSLKWAKEAMDDVAVYINEAKRDSDHLQMLKHLKRNIIFERNFNEELDITEYGRLLVDGLVKIKSHDDNKLRLRFIFVFTKAILLCKVVKQNMYSFKKLLHLNEFQIEDNCTYRINTKENQWSHQWHLVEKSKKTVYTMYTRTGEVKKLMMNSIRSAIDDLEPRDSLSMDHKFEITTFPCPVICSVCLKFLKGLIDQGYLCTVCKIIVHKPCISESDRCSDSPKQWKKCGSDSDIEIVGAGNTNIHGLSKDYLWFGGEIDRETARLKLEKRLAGTFMVRLRLSNDNNVQSIDTPYALTLKLQDSVKHMKIFAEKIDDFHQYFLSRSRYFKSIVDLINHYEYASLEENFSGLNATLKWPYRQLIAVVTNDFSSSDSKFLQLTKGDRIIVLNKNTPMQSIWKGKLDDTVGYFPSNCVSEEKEVIYDVITDL